MNKAMRNSAYIHKKTSSEIICENMGLQNQTIFQDFRCTYRQKISYFGRLYIGEEHVMFVSNMFGIVKKLALSIDSIVSIQQPQSSALIIVAQNEGNIQHQYSFTGFQNDHSFKIINALWKREKLQADIMIMTEQDKQNESNDRVVSGFDNSEVQISLFQERGSEKEPVKMLQIMFPCSVQQFYDFFLADNANLYSRKKHLQLRKAHSIKISNWRKNEQLDAQTREIAAVIKVRGVPLINEARMSQVCMLKKNEKNQINLKVVTNMGDVPYHSYFNCEEHITVIKEGETKCRYTVKSVIVFNKNTYMKGTIISKTFSDFNEQYKMWSDNCKEMLEKKMKQIEQSMVDNVRKKIDKKQMDLVEFEFHKDQNQVQQTNEEKKQQKQDNGFQKQLLDIKNRIVQIQLILKKQNWLIIFLLGLNIISIVIQIGKMISSKSAGEQS